MFLLKVILKCIVAMSLAGLTLGIACYYSFLALVLGFLGDAFVILLHCISVTLIALFIVFVKEKLLLKLLLLFVLYSLILPIPFRILPNFQKTLKIDSCIDDGGVWDYQRDCCILDDVRK